MNNSITLTVSRIYLFTVGLFFYLIMGGLFLFDPAALFDRIDIVLGSPMAIEELRASHGGVWFITGIFCLTAVWKTSLIRDALIFLLVFNGGYAIGRIYSFAFGGVPAADLILLFAFDLSLVVISVILLTRGGNRKVELSE